MTDTLARSGFKGYQVNQYQLLTVRDVQKDEAAIIEVLSAIMAGEKSNDLVLLNYYKELPVSFGAGIERIDRGVVDMKVHKVQLIAMLLQQMTFIKSEHLPYCVIAKVLKVKKAESLALLTQFAYVHIPSEQRTYVRVTVLDKVQAFFRSDLLEVSGTIVDISYGGVAILVSGESDLKENANGLVTLCLPDATLDIPGTLLRIESHYASRKYVIRLEMDAKSEKIVSRFIFHEQIGILRELKDMSG